MAMIGNSVTVFFAGLCLFSSVSFGLCEHASSAVSHKPQNRGNEMKQGFLTSSDQLRQGMKEAVDEALGVGHGIDQQGLEVIRQSIEPMWGALHKNSQGRVDRRSFRYVVQDFFMQRHHLSIVGLESNLANDTKSEAALLTTFAPNYVKKVVNGDSSINGFVMDDAVAMIAALRRLIENTGTHMLEDSYQSKGMDSQMDVGREAMVKVMEGYMLRWMMGDDAEGVQMLESNATLMETSFDDWPEIAQFARGHVLSFEHAQQRSRASTWNGLRPHFSFADAQAIVGGVALSFGYFWETECLYVKNSLVKMDYTNTGRVKLSDFHNSALNGEWRFSESKEYLKVMGALDETSSWQGPRVIITNYLQAPSNCIISTDHYRICCQNECQEFFDNLEETIGGAVSTVEEILPIIERLHTPRFDEDSFDVEPNLTSSLKSQLEQIASTHAGRVPIHGRLFAQWMHYVFPLECPFPHKSGTTSTLAPLAFGDAYMATDAEMTSHSSETQDNETALVGADLENEWMSQWSDEEELLTHIASSSWGTDLSTAFGFMVVSAIAVFLVKAGIVSTGGKAKQEDYMPKSHFV